MRPSIEERFLDKVLPEPNSGCWLWDGAATRQPGVSVNCYGLIMYRNKLVKATHVSLMLDGRPRPSDKAIACHSCDVQLCVNPAHLSWGTFRSNLEDAVARSGTSVRWLGDNTHCKHGHAFTVETTYVYAGRRRCRVCIRRNGRAFRARERDKLETD